MMMKTRPLFWLLAVVAVATLTGCGKANRSIRRRCKEYQVLMCQDKFREAAKELHAKGDVGFTWVKHDGTTIKGTASRAFLTSIREIDDRKDVHIHIRGITRINDNKYVMKVKFQVNASTATALSNVLWEASITWIRHKKKWWIGEIKDLTKRTQKRS